MFRSARDLEEHERFARMDSYGDTVSAHVIDGCGNEWDHSPVRQFGPGTGGEMA